MEQVGFASKVDKDRSIAIGSSNGLAVWISFLVLCRWPYNRRIDCPGRSTALNLGLFRGSTCRFRLAISSLLMTAARWTIE